MKTMFTLLALASFPLPAAFAAPDAQKLLETSDRSRGSAAAQEGLSWEAAVHSVEGGETRDVVYRVKVRGVDAIAEVTSPPRQKGEVVLFNDRNLWYYKPGLKKPVSISARQKLVGQAANGDIASTNYARDYEATSVTEDKIGNVPLWKLELKAKAKNVTYDRIRYWVSKDRILALKAEFLTVSGQVFKIATFRYANTLDTAGKKASFVSEMRIQDAFNAQNVTSITYKNPVPEAHAPAIFNVNNLIK